MVKFIIAFRKPDDAPDAQTRFEAAYNGFLALAEQMPELRRRQVCHIFGSPFGEPTFYRVLELYFDDHPALDAALRSPTGQAAGAELTKMVRGAFDLSFADVYEA
ncbi:MAG: EthD family reductase [Chloroflexota bacterium]|nr:EthD family reductase [Chloroflexota bacterium]